ncbi:hypothetical protein ACVPOY_03620 [Staphylococcus aureus]
MNDIMYRAEQHKLSIVDVDALTGQAIGRPKTGTYALSNCSWFRYCSVCN